jgi:hypothetical protein
MDQQALLRKIPKMDELWNLMESRQEIALVEPVFVKDELRQVLQALRESILQQEGTGISEKEISPRVYH